MLGCFHILAIMSNAVTKVSVQVSEFLLSFLWGIYLEVELLNYMVTYYLTF